MIASIENASFRVSARTTGAELASFYDKKADYEYLWQPCDIWNGQSPLLFPVVGKLKDDTYYLNGKKYNLAKHGFARKAEFELESHTDTEMTFLLRDGEMTRASYPYGFELRVHYFLTESGFVMEHRVRTTGSEKMYFSLGAHPGFACEMGDKLVLDEIETASAFQLDENFLRAKETLPVFDNSREIVVTEDVFKNDALIFDGLRSNGATLVRANGKNVHVDFGGAPCLGVWAKPGAKYVCIEPWYGIDDAWDAKQDLATKHRICSVEPGAEFVFPVTVRAL